MKADLDKLMEVNDLDALLITGPGRHNPAMYYMVGDAHLTQADLIKLRNEDVVLFCNPMERDEAAKTGLPTKNLSAYRLVDKLKENDGSMLKALAMRYKEMFTDLGLTSGRVGLYGCVEAGMTFAVFNRVQEIMPEINFVGEVDDATLLLARATKDESEVNRIRQVGRITTAVVAEVADYLTSHRVRDGQLVKPDGELLTIGDVKRRIDLWLLERGAENPEGTIFAIGRDAGVPHSVGTATDGLRLGQTIIFDIYPCEAGGGYFYDFTRTWCLGYAPEEVQALYEQVYAVYTKILDELETGVHCPEYQQLACDLFAAQGHVTIQQDTQAEEGYVHSLGHGLGLSVHERPWFSRNATPADRLEGGSVFTIEPGLYYPSRGMGVRLEDTLWMRPDGKAEVLAPYPLDLVLPIRQTS